MSRWGILLGLLLLTEPAWAQSTLAVPFGNAVFAWDWAGTADVETTFTLTCTPTAGASIVTVEIPSTLRTWPVRDGVPGPGTYTCGLVATNPFGTSEPSNDVVFRAGNAPSKATNFHIEVR